MERTRDSNRRYGRGFVELCWGGKQKRMWFSFSVGGRDELGNKYGTGNKPTRNNGGLILENEGQASIFRRTGGTYRGKTKEEDAIQKNSLSWGHRKRDGETGLKEYSGMVKLKKTKEMVGKNVKSC